LRWTLQKTTPLANGDTGSISVTEEGLIALFPHLVGPQYGLDRQVPAPGDATLNSWQTASHATDSPRPKVGIGFRDPTRAVKVPAGDASWYVGVGSGFGGANNSTALPGSGTGCLAWMKATNASLVEFEFAGCLIENNHTTGHIDPGTVSWQDQDMASAFFECPDVFPLDRLPGAGMVAIASFYNWAEGGYFTNEWFVGQIDSADSKTWTTTKRGLLDYGQYYSARTGTTGDLPGGSQEPTARRVIFGATGWHNPPGMDGSCNPQIHLIPRDVGIDPLTGGLSLTPIPELASIRVPGASASGRVNPRLAEPIATGSRLQLQMNCTWASRGGGGGSGSPAAAVGEGEVVGFRVLASSDRSGYTTVGYNFTSGRMFVDHTHSSPAHSSAIVQTTAPQLVVVQGDSTLVLDVLVDGALIELFGNRRAVISSFITEVMQEGANFTAPDDRQAFAVSPPPDVASCTYAAHSLIALLP